jgi:5-hydroxyisourate hydrolase
MRRISTHVLDLALGKPASEVAVRLERQEPSGWRLLGTERTDRDGRCGQLLPDSEGLSAGSYRLAFDIMTYYQAQNINALYPVIEVTFRVRAGETQLHIPLLLSPNGYTTYRGS